MVKVKVDKIKDAVAKLNPSGSTFVTASEYGQQRKKVIRISTGSKNLDTILGGGFTTMSISEVHYWFIYLPKIRAIAERFGVDGDACLENILYARAVNSEVQMELIQKLSEPFASGEYRLLVIDSIMACFRVDYSGRGELSERQQKLGQMLARLTTMAEEFNIAVYMVSVTRTIVATVGPTPKHFQLQALIEHLETNQVQSDPGASALFAGADGRKPGEGGHVLAHASATRVLLRKGRGEERVAKIQDSPDCPEREATYVISNGGITDPEGS
ncbi:hypothetical protein ABW19_dt0204611 [Dactylella cylindrospora]|nr:hypothetical protein ABW19_dt0204611 [Dactylella cylindrospora]